MMRQKAVFIRETGNVVDVRHQQTVADLVNAFEVFLGNGHGRATNGLTPDETSVDRTTEAALNNLCRGLADLLRCAFVRVPLTTGTGLIRVVAEGGPEANLGRLGTIAFADLESLPEPEAAALRSGHTQVRTKTRLIPPQGAGPETVEVGGWMVIPLQGDGRTIGALSMATPVGTAFPRTLVPDLEKLGQRVAAALARKMESAEDRALLGAFIGEAPFAAAVADAGGKILWANQAYAGLTGCAADSVAGRRLASGRGHALPGSGASPSALRRVERIEVGETEGRRPDGKTYSAEETIYAVRNRKGQTANYIAVYRDVTDRKRAEARARHAARHDPLTGLANRSVLNDRLHVATAQAKRSRRMVALVMLDIHRFKLVNDSFGHEGGDTLLKQVAERLIRCVRDGDTVARLGSDEFAVVQTEVAHVQDVASLAQRIIDAFDSPFTVGDSQVTVGVNIGITVYPVDDGDARRMLRNADVALRRAAAGEGKNTYLFYTAAMGDQVRERLELINAIHQAIERNELVLHHQPQVDVSTSAVVGTEALIRWVRPGIGMVPPGAFIAVAEECGLIVPIGNWAMREACAQVRRWQAAGLEPLPVAVNMSAVQLHSRNLVETVVDILEETELDPELLQIEITESMLMQDAERAAATLRQLSDHGVSIAVDDFGTGHSSLNYLKRLPVDKLKIDRTFVREVPGNFQDSAISKAIIGLGHSLELKVIAEGVEYTDQLSFLSDEGCDEVQGFLFARPQAAVDLSAFLRHGYRPTPAANGRASG